MKKRDDYNRRPFVLTRSFFLGSQKFGTYWTGDNRSIFSEIGGSMTMILQLGNAGHPFGGSDVPGFYGMPTEDMWVMFYQMGMYYPFFRAHTHIDFPNREPWLQTQRVQEAIRDSINRRYDLIHYIYTTFERSTRTAEPLMRTMWNEFPDQQIMWDVASQFMFGDSLLVAPKITKPDDLHTQFKLQQVNYILPNDELWYNFYTKTQATETGVEVTVDITDLEQAVFVRGGSVLPILLHEDCMALLPCIKNPIRLEVYLNENDSAGGALYLDDGETYEFMNSTDGHADISFGYWGNQLTSTNNAGNNYETGRDQVVTQVVIYGFKSSPADVLSGSIEVPYTYIASQEALLIDTSARRVDIDNVGIEVVWN
jgi:alpha 1,3-glucosidase